MPDRYVESVRSGFYVCIHIYLHVSVFRTSLSMCVLVSFARFSASAQRSVSLLAYIDILDSSLATIPIGIKPKEKCREYKWGPFFSTQSRTWLSWRTRQQRCHDMPSLGNMALSDTAGEAQWEEKFKIRGIIVENSDCPTVVAWGFVHFFVSIIINRFGAILSVCKVMVCHLLTQLMIHRASGAVHQEMCSGGLPSDCVLIRGIPRRLIGPELRE